jgi:DNA-binding NarL/FixJ family response regulator
VLCEGDLVVREGVRGLLESLDGVEVVEAVADLAAMESAVGRLRPDVVVTGIHAQSTEPDACLRFAARLRETQPRIGVVVLARDPAPEDARALFEGGAAGRAFLGTAGITDAAQLGVAVRAVAAGESHLDSTMIEELVAARAGGGQKGLDALTPRQQEVLALIADAKSNDAVARRLGVTTRAVERNVNGIYARLGILHSTDVSRRVLAALLYHRAGRDGAGV